MSNTKAKIVAALEKIGHANGHAAPASQDPMDAVLHEYNVTSIGETHFKKRRDAAKELLIKTMGADAVSKLDDKKAEVKKLETSTSVQLASASSYALAAQIKIGASFLDTQKLKVELLKKMSAVEVEALIEKCTDRRDPSVTYNVTEL